MYGRKINMRKDLGNEIIDRLQSTCFAAIEKDLEVIFYGL